MAPTSRPVGDGYGYGYGGGDGYGYGSGFGSVSNSARLRPARNASTVGEN